MKNAENLPIPQYYEPTSDQNEAVEGSDGALHVREKAREIAIRAYDGTSDAIAAGATKTYAAQDLAGYTEFSVYVAEMNQAYEIYVQSRPHASMGYSVEEKAIGTAMSAGTSRRHGFVLDGPLTATDVQIVVKNTSGSAATIKGVYIVAR